MPSSQFEYPITDHYDKKKFYNQDRKLQRPNLWSVIKWTFTSKSYKWREIQLEKQDSPPQNVSNGNIRISSVGHATFLIQLSGQNILTDPVWSERASPFKWIGPKRIVKVGIDIGKLPKIDIVLVSHNHYDHLDTDTLKKLWIHSKPVFVVPLKNARLIKKIIPKAEVYELDWWQNRNFSSLVIHLIPSQHWSSRWIIDNNHDLWGGFVIQAAEGQICFIGDSGYNKQMFTEIGQKFPNIIFAILPIGSYQPRWFMKDVHMNPQDALTAYQDLGAKYFIPSHFGVFKLSDESYETQLQDYQDAISKSTLNKENIITLMPGEFVLKKF